MDAWDDQPTDCRLLLAEAGVQHACAILAQQAEALAGEIERGEVEDRGGPAALRLLARLIRLANLYNVVPAGRA